MAYQRLYLPIKEYKVTQGYGLVCTGQHRHAYALDCGGILNIYAPFDCKVTKLYVKKGNSNEVWLTSTNKVLARNGEYDYFTMSITHPKDIELLKVGQTFKQGDLVCTTKKMTGVSSGNHAHIELSKGKKAGWVVKSGYYVNVNAIKPDKYCFMMEDCKRTWESYRLVKYHIDKESEITVHVNSKDGLDLHKTKDYYDKTVIHTLKNKDDVILLRTEGSYALVYRVGKLGWVCRKYLK
ncbi:MAG: M23 family metallopeptidase [Clostridia bacterium]|nr:M23 family metallopeptidase [Clostridia bacterium]